MRSEAELRALEQDLLLASADAFSVRRDPTDSAEITALLMVLRWCQGDEDPQVQKLIDHVRGWAEFARRKVAERQRASRQ